MLRILAFILTLVFLGLFWHLHINPKNDYARVSYQELKLRQEYQQGVLLLFEQKKSTGDDERIRQQMMASAQRDYKTVHDQVVMRQVSMVLALVTGLLFVASMIRTLRGSSGAKSAAGFRHNGTVQSEPSRVDYINPDDLPGRLMKGYGNREDAENWLRTDDFLKCTTCQKAAKVDRIGTVQEILLYEDLGKDTAKNPLNHLGSIWTVKTIDRYVCTACGEQAVRSVR